MKPQEAFLSDRRELIHEGCVNGIHAIDARTRRPPESSHAFVETATLIQVMCFSLLFFRMIFSRAEYHPFCYTPVMSRIDKTSVRQEVNRIKKEFDELSQTNEISKECKVLFKSMLMLINILISVFMEKLTLKNNKNSSKPSSQTSKDDSFIPDTGAKGKGKEESRRLADNTRTVENTTVIEVIECSNCGCDLKNVPCECRERRSKIDIIFEKTVEHVDAEIKHCPECDATVKGSFPMDMPGPLQYGNGLKAYVINLLIGQMISLNRAQKMVNTILGEKLSEASLLSYILSLHDALRGWEIRSKNQLLESPSLNTDETSLRVEKKNQWIHVYSAGEITLKFLHPQRGTEAIEKINIIPRYQGVIIHDCWSPYLTYAHCEHGLCGSHLVRELTYVIESNNYVWAQDMKNLLLETCKRVSKRKKKQLFAREYRALEKNYRKILKQGKEEMPAIAKKRQGARGKIAKSDAHNLWERFNIHESAVLLFAKKSEVSFTNNRAERDLRMAKVKQKVSGCFRKKMYAQAYCRISSYLQTMANKGYNPLIAVQMALTGEFRNIE
jgi:transposase